MTDLWTVLRKEWRDAASQEGSRVNAVLGFLFGLLFLGVAFPLFQGRDWLSGNSGTLLFVPVFFVAPLIADAFAGERERRTLETLLSTRLPDRAIVLGKIAAAVAVGWAFTLAFRLLGWLTVSLAHGDGSWLAPTAGWWGSTLLSLLACVFVGGVGALVSMRSPSVKAATQRTSWVALLLVFVPFILLTGTALGIATYLESLPDSTREAREGAFWLPFWIVAAIASLAVVLAPVVIAVRRFRRDTILLD